VHTRVCDQFGIEFPIFAFSHCRDVVAAVSRAGGVGVLGAVGFSPEQLEIELDWIDDHVDGRPYGVDVIMPAKAIEAAAAGVDDLVEQLQGMLPDEHLAFVATLIDRFALPGLPEEVDHFQGVVGWAPQVAEQLLDVTFAHPVSLVVNALGPPPPEVVSRAHDTGVKVAALAGRAQHAEAHVRIGVDLVVAQGTEAGGHTGEIATMVLVPEVVEAVGHQVPVLAAGGIARGRQVAAARALGADGVWTGSVWLTAAESDATPDVLDRYLSASSGDTVRSRSFTGKPARMLRTPWTEAWEAPDSPGTLPMPLQNILIAGAAERYFRSGRQGEFFAPVGQVVGQMRRVTPVREILFEMVDEYIATVSGLSTELERS